MLEKYAPRWATWQVPVIVNVAGESVEDYVAVARKLDEQPGVAGIELNISCPNVGKGGLQFALDARAAAEVTAAVRRATELPLLVKLSPAATDVRGIAIAIEDAGADAICAVNTLSGMALDRHTRKPLLGNTYGGLSGPALKPVALRVVYEVAQVVDIPIVAIGGVSELDDVLDFLMAGACAVQVGTALFADPVLPVRLIDELEAWCARPRHGLPSRARRRGAARVAATDPASRAWSTGPTHRDERRLSGQGRGPSGASVRAWRRLVHARIRPVHPGGGKSLQQLYDEFQMAEDLGFDHAWLPDHVKNPDGPPTDAMHETWTVLTAIAARTSRIRLGPLVSSNTFRHPAMLLKQAVTVDHVSGGPAGPGHRHGLVRGGAPPLRHRLPVGRGAGGPARGSGPDHAAADGRGPRLVPGSLLPAR